jgi:hypothetical protein
LLIFINLGRLSRFNSGFCWKGGVQAVAHLLGKLLD